MANPFGRIVAIVDPRAARGRVREELPELERQLQSRRLEYEFVEAETPGEATTAAREALANGDRYLVAVGDDGTVNDVINGMLADDKPVAEDAVLGVIAAGTGADFVRTFGLPEDVIKATRHLTGDRLYPVDAGKLTYREGNAEVSRYFVNVAQVGMGAAITGRARRMGGLGRGGYFLGFWASLIRQRSFDVQVRADHKRYEHKAHNVIVANCQYGGGGMRISPRSYPGDGFFDVQVSIGPRSEAFRSIPKLYRGEHIPSPTIKELRGAVIHVEADRILPVEADGRVLGETPASFEIIKHAIRLKI